MPPASETLTSFATPYAGDGERSGGRETYGRWLRPPKLSRVSLRARWTSKARRRNRRRWDDPLLLPDTLPFSCPAAPRVNASSRPLAGRRPSGLANDAKIAVIKAQSVGLIRLRLMIEQFNGMRETGCFLIIYLSP